jgi:hypothetical protein
VRRATSGLRSRPGELQIQRVASPRNQISSLTNLPCDKYGTNARADRASSRRLSISRSRCESKRSAFVVPAHLQSSPHFLVGHVQVALRLLDARVSEHQLNDADVDAVREQAARAFVPQVVPAEVDLFELLPIPLRALPSGLRFDAVRE